MDKVELLRYIAVTFAFLLFISLYFNFKFSKMLKKYRKNENILIRSAYFNPVTDLPNRENIDLIISEQIDRALRHNQTFLLTVIKLKNYHEVKMHSEKLANEFIIEASDRLLASIRDEDSLAHITDDGFVIVFNEYLDEENYDVILQRIKESFSNKPNLDTKYQIDFEIAYGHSKYPDDGTDAGLLIDTATKKALK